ncbi:MAG TPA: YetF domain-containing protein [Gaiellaceae bacterium]|nr:YetF domain-containing protein [Gaiellaceae bacterium]
MDIVLRGIVVFAFLLVLTRIIGRRELSSLQPFDLILLIILGDAVQQGLTQDDYSLTGAGLAIGTIAILQVFVSWVGYRFPRTRKILEGVPIIVVQDGEVIEANLKRERLDIDEIYEQARIQGIEHLSQVKWAVLETNGQLSFIKKQS